MIQTKAVYFDLNEAQAQETSERDKMILTIKSVKRTILVALIRRIFSY